ncbi:PREDICTED: APOBEC1 complementation factor isoform X2 [Nelumbo nucifera]|uniref:APOBEC1 complementation factor isoform X2 n=2 Tax=Nelumbo nucifera TaxID=4432 RepID=A0A1U8A129_NELNU|nr:PREDICTED: APOBEC1 complementation factor isoform X2 [Nelumbo nucifera]DAD44016.1 TPA_asm: hypothetical protein HUJ06_002246 [Nelumbo nucifera]
MLGAITFPSSATPPTLRVPVLGYSNVRNSRLLKLRACLFDFPLASKIIVRNLSHSTSEAKLQKEFSNFVKIVKDEATKKSRGYAFVQYTSQDDAMLALENMDCKYIDGRLVHVELAKPVKNTFGAYPRSSGPPPTT